MNISLEVQEHGGTPVVAVETGQMKGCVPILIIVGYALSLLFEQDFNHSTWNKTWGSRFSGMGIGIVGWNTRKRVGSI